MSKKSFINQGFILVCLCSIVAVQPADPKDTQSITVQTVQTGDGNAQTVVTTSGTGQKPQIIHTNQPISFNFPLLPGFPQVGRKKRDTQTVTIQTVQSNNGNGHSVVTTSGTGQQPQVFHTNQPISLLNFPNLLGRKKRDTQTVSIQTVQTNNGNGHSVVTTSGTGQQPQVFHTNQPISLLNFPNLFGRKKRDTQTVTIQTIQTSNGNGQSVVTTSGTGQQPQVFHTNQPISLLNFPNLLGRKKREIGEREKRQYRGSGVTYQSTQTSDGGKPVSNTVISTFGTGQKPTVIHSNQPINFPAIGFGNFGAPGFGAGFPNLFGPTQHNRPTGLDTRFPEVGGSNAPNSAGGFPASPFGSFGSFPGFGAGIPNFGSFGAFPFGGGAASAPFNPVQLSPTYQTQRPVTRYTTRYTTRPTTRYTTRYTTTRTPYTTTRRIKRDVEAANTEVKAQAMNIVLPNFGYDSAVEVTTKKSKQEIEVDPEEVPQGYSALCLLHLCGK